MENYITYKALVKTLEADYRRAAKVNDQHTCCKIANELEGIWKRGIKNGWEA